MNFLDLPPLYGAQGEVHLPGSKSISNRVLLLAALAEGETDIHDLLMADDVERMLEALCALGVQCTRIQGDTLQAGRYQVRGVGGAFPVKEAALLLGNAGTAFRPLTAALALCGGTYRLSGVARMHERPIGDLVEALRQLGAEIVYEGNKGFPPLLIRPGSIVPCDVVRVRGNVSSQFLTALLMALPLLGRETVIEVVGELISKPYIAITLELMAQFGVRVRHDNWTRFVVPADACYRSPGTIHVEGDASSASYFLAAGAIGGGAVRVNGIGRHSIQGDIHFAQTLETLGAQVEMGESWIEVRAPKAGRLRAFDLDLNMIPDAAMTLAVAALFTDGPCMLRNIASWRVKETDRLSAMATELRKVGAKVEEGIDFLRVTPPARLCPATIDTYDDHRMAMCFSLTTLGGCRMRINDPGCVNKTFPGYFDVFAAVGQVVPIVAIDGPSASGKGTVAARVAEVLGFHCLDSGALYRLVALAAMRMGITFDDEARLCTLATGLSARFERGMVWMGEEEVSEDIRSEACSAGASAVAVFPSVRAALLDRQRDFCAMPGLVAEGRDMASVVFPYAGLKFFLTASVECRAERRYKQLMKKRLPVSIESLLQDLRARDERDTTRAVAPLRKEPEAVLLDTTSMGIEEAVAFIVERAYQQWPGCNSKSAIR